MIFLHQKASLRLIWIFLIAISSSSGVFGSRPRRQIVDNKRVVCYFANWAVYRQGTGKFSPQNINPYLCTHLIYAFGGLSKDDTIQPFDKYQDLEKGGYGQFAALKTYNKELKTLLAIGGWNEGSRRFSPLVADPERRKNFIRSAVRFLRQYNFDGLDLDWEYPSFRDGGKPEDRANYAKFVQEMRQTFESEAQKTGKERLLITMAVPASLEYAGQGFDIEKLDESLDFFNLLTYDYHSSYEPAVNHHSPLFRPHDVSEFDFRSDLNIDATIKFYINQGASREKLVLGIPTYGRSYTLVNPDAHSLGSPTDGPGEKGAYTKEDGYLAYYEVCEGIKNDNWEVVVPNPGELGPYAHKDRLWVGYDDEDIVREKAHYVVEEGLGGIMFWTIDNDDFRGACGSRPFPLIESAKEALYGKEGPIRTATSVSVSTSEQTRVERLKLNPNELAQLSSHITKPDRPVKTSSPSVATERTTTQTFRVYDPFSTPEPPTTPSNEPAFKCTDEGFFPHTHSCKKYFWCLEVPSSGMVAHTFTCPQGLYFNALTDGCDFRRNVDCKGKDEQSEETTKKTTESTTEGATSSEEEETKHDKNKKDPQTLEEVLEAIKQAGGIDEFEAKLKREEEEKKAAIKKEEERRQEISEKTRSRLTKLLDRKRAEVQHELESPSPSTDQSTAAPSESSSDASVERRPPGGDGAEQEVTDAKQPDLESQRSPAPSSSTPSTPKSRTRTSLFSNRNRFNLSNRSKFESSPDELASTTTTSRPPASKSILQGRDRFRNLLRTTTATPKTLSTSSTPPSTVLDDDQIETNGRDDEKAALEESTAPTKVEIIGTIPKLQLEDQPESITLRPNRFRPQVGIRDRVRTALQGQLDDPDSVSPDTPGLERPRSSSSQSSEPEEAEGLPADSNSTAQTTTTATTTPRPLEYVTLRRGTGTASSYIGDTDDSYSLRPPTPAPSAASSSANLSGQQIVTSSERTTISSTSTTTLSGSVRDLEYVTIQRGGPVVSGGDEDEANNKVGSIRFIGEFDDASHPTPNPRTPRRLSLVKRDTLSVVYPSDGPSQLEQVHVVPSELPYEQGVAYIYPNSPDVLRGHRQTSADHQILTSSEPEEVTTAKVNEETSTEKEQILSVSVSQSQSESFFIPEVLNSIVDFIATTIMPSSETSGEPEEVAAMSSTATPDTTFETSTSSTPSTQSSTTSTSTTTTFTSSETANLITEGTKIRKGDRFAAGGKRVHPFLKQAKLDSSTVATTTTSTTRTVSTNRQPFFRQRFAAAQKKNDTDIIEEPISSTKPSIPVSTTSPTETEVSKQSGPFEDEAALEGSGDGWGIHEVSGKDIMALEDDGDESKTDNPIAVPELRDIENETENKTHASAPGNIKKLDILSNKSLRPQLKLSKRPPSVSSRDAASTQGTAATVSSENEVSSKDKGDTTPSPSTRSRLSRPRGLSALRLASKSQLKPSGHDFPIDLSASPSQTVHRSRPFVGRKISTTARPEAEGASTEETISVSTEKLTVADVLATLHGEPEPESKPSTLRPKAFKPKLGSQERSKLREKLKEHLIEEHSGDGPEETANTISHQNEDVRSTTESISVITANRNRIRPAPFRPLVRGDSEPIQPSSLHSSSRKDPPELVRRRPGAHRLQAKPIPSSVAEGEYLDIHPQPATRQPVQPLTPGGRVLSEVDILSSLGIQKPSSTSTEATDFAIAEEESSGSDEELPSTISVVTESVAPMNLLEVLSHEGGKSSFPAVGDESDVEFTERPSIITSFLKSAVVDSVALPQPTKDSFQPNLVVDEPVPDEQNEALPSALHHSSRFSELPRSRNRFDPINLRSSQGSAQLPRQESRRLRSRQRGRALHSEPVEDVNEAAAEAAPAPVAPVAEVARPEVRRRQPFRQHVAPVITSPPHPDTVPSTEHATNRVKLNRIRHGGGFRSTTTRPENSESFSSDESIGAADDSSEKKHQNDERHSRPQPNFSEAVVKNSRLKGKSNHSHDDGQEDLNNAIVKPSSSSVENDAPVASETSSELKELKLSFGEKHRQAAARTKLLNLGLAQADEDEGSGAESPQDSDYVTTTQNVLSVSVAEGISAIPASSLFHISTPSTLKTVSSTESVVVTTPTALTRFGRSTVGYSSTEALVRHGISEQPDRELVETTTTGFSEPSSTTERATFSTAASHSLFGRKKGDFLNKLSLKLAAEREAREKVLLKSFADASDQRQREKDDVVNEKTSEEDQPRRKLPALLGHKTFPSSLKSLRPTIIGSTTPRIEAEEEEELKPDETSEVEPSTEDSFAVDSFESSTQLSDSSSSTNTTITTNSTSFIPTPRPLPPEIKLSFNKHIASKPIFLSFKKYGKKTEPSPIDVDNTSPATNSTEAAESAPSSTTQATSVVSRLPSIKTKLNKFGGKTFSKLLDLGNRTETTAAPEVSSLTSTQPAVDTQAEFDLGPSSEPSIDEDLAANIDSDPSSLILSSLTELQDEEDPKIEEQQDQQEAPQRDELRHPEQPRRLDISAIHQIPQGEPETKRPEEALFQSVQKNRLVTNSEKPQTSFHPRARPNNVRNSFNGNRARLVPSNNENRVDQEQNTAPVRRKIITNDINSRSRNRIRPRVDQVSSSTTIGTSATFPTTTTSSTSRKTVRTTAAFNNDELEDTTDTPELPILTESPIFVSSQTPQSFDIVQPISRPKAPRRPPVVAPPTRARDPFRRVTTPKSHDYEYHDNDDASPVKSIDDYDLVPLTSKVQILPSGAPVCSDVGVFPHPHSCRKFVTCHRRAINEGNIMGWVYECPSYLAFDPVGGRCNWASDFYCT